MSDLYDKETAIDGEVDGEKLPSYNIIRSSQIDKNVFKLFTEEFVYIMSYCDEGCPDENNEVNQIYCVDVYSYKNANIELIRSYDDRKNPHARKVFWYAMLLSEIINKQLIG